MKGPYKDILDLDAKLRSGRIGSEIHGPEGDDEQTWHYKFIDGKVQRQLDTGDWVEVVKDQ